MLKYCSLCDRRLPLYNKEGVCSKCKSEFKKIIRIKNKDRKPQLLIDDLIEINNNTVDLINSIPEKEDMEDIIFNILDLIESIDNLCDNSKIDLKYYIDDYYNKRGIKNEKYRTR